jgi:hypothetical protein
MRKAIVSLLVLVMMPAFASQALAAVDNLDTIAQLEQIPPGVVALPAPTGAPGGAPVFYSDGITFSRGGVIFQYTGSADAAGEDYTTYRNAAYPVVWLPFKLVARAFSLSYTEASGRTAAVKVYSPNIGEVLYLDFAYRSMQVIPAKPAPIYDDFARSGMGDFICYVNGVEYIEDKVAYALFSNMLIIAIVR